MFRNSIILIILAFTLALSSCRGIKMHGEKIQGKPSSQVWFPEDRFEIDSVASLVVPESGTFRILVLGDIQLDGNPFRTRKAFKQITALVDSAQPDFIFTLGDNSEWNYSDKMAKKLVKFLDGFNIPWAVVLGNHDSEGRRFRPWFGNMYESGKHSLFKYGPSNIHGVGNYPVVLEDKNGNIIYAFIFMDSNVHRQYEDGVGYDFIHRDQMEWYKWNIKGISEAQYGSYDPASGKVVPSFTIFHIPLLEFGEAIKAYQEGKIDSSLVMGEAREAVASSRINSGFFNLMKEMKSTTHVFNGHDHVNNISIPWQGIRMTYGLKSAPTSYFAKDMQGGLLITIREKGKGQKPEVNLKYIFLNRK